MKTIHAFALITVLAVSAGSVEACSGGTPSAQTVLADTQTALSTVQEACVMANAVFPKTLISQACGIVGPYVDKIDNIVKSTFGAGIAKTRPYLVTCEDTDAGIVCEKPYVADAGK